MITFRYKATANRNKITAKKHKMTPENQSDYKERDGKEPESNMGSEEEMQKFKQIDAKQLQRETK